MNTDNDKVNGITAARCRFPPWLKKRLPPTGEMERVHRLLKEQRLATVCQSAHCPNQCECFARGTATFMILGDLCTRDCRFCAVQHGPAPAPDPDEPRRVAEAVAALQLDYVVITSVTRDDLPDGGADQFRRTIEAIRASGSCRIEVLTPDFKGDRAAMDHVASAAPDVYNHNIETVPRLYRTVRPQADYRRSLDLLRHVKETFPSVWTKSGLMVGLGESRDEILQAFRDLRAAGCDLLTVGQYLAPSGAHLPVQRYIPPDEFADYEQEARTMGFAGAACGPFVRSSYRADAMFGAAGNRKQS